MDVMTATSTSYDTDSATTPPAVPEKIRAYYSLVFPNFTYYLQTLSVTIGRRCIPPNSSEQGTVDVDLGPLKSVSRLHAKIEYEEDKERFVLVVIGRNGAWVDGVWSGTGSRQPLSERSQIQIASRTFEFVLPPPPAPEDSPSPSSHSSATRPRSPSVDITSISPPSSMPSHTPPPTHITPTHPKNQLPSLPGATGKVKSNLNSKKRKKSNHVPLPIPKPEDMPPRPQLTYAQLCYRAIKAMGGKATLQDINQWIMESFDWYKYNDVGWQSSVRHNLSSNPAFKKMERCSDAKRKGFFWSVDEKFQQSFEEQEARSQVGNLQDNEGGKDGRSSKKKGKANVSVLQPALKRSVKMDSKGGPLPPPLTSTPLVPKSSAAFGSAQLLSSSFSPGSAQFNSHSILPPTLNSSTPQISASSASNSSILTAGSTNGTSVDTQSTSIPPLPPSLYIPIVVGPIPASHSSSSLATDPNNTNPLASTAIVLHESTLILNPEVFSHLTPEQVKELEGLGAQKALEILQGYIARFLKEQRLKKREGVRGRGRGRGTPKRGRGGGRTSDGTSTINESSSIDASANDKPTLGNSTLFTTTPLPLRDVQPQPTGETSNGSAQSVHPPVDVAEPISVDTKPPVPVPMADTSVMAVDDSADPIVIVDDSDSSEAPATKRRKLDVPSIS